MDKFKTSKIRPMTWIGRKKNKAKSLNLINSWKIKSNDFKNRLSKNRQIFKKRKIQ